MINGDADPTEKLTFIQGWWELLIVIIIRTLHLLRHNTLWGGESRQFLIVDGKVSFQFLHIKFEVITLGEHAELLNEKHRIIFLCGHQQVIIG